MPLESASYINQLVTSNPTVSDGVSQGDDHLRLIKTAVKGSFPNFTGAAVASTEAQLDAGAAVAETGAAKLADSGAFFNTNSTDGVTNPAAGEVDIKAGGVAALKIKSDGSAQISGAASVGGALSATGAITGPGSTPIGGSIIWWDDTLPDPKYGTWAWCNGGTYVRSNTELFARLGTKFGSGDGSTTANLPDLRENVPVGKSTMGATSTPGRVTNFVLDTLGKLFGECLHTLGFSELPANIPNNASTTTTISTPSGLYVGSGVASANSPGNTNFPDGNNNFPSLTASSTTVVGINPGGGGSHNNVQPGIVCNWIIRVA